MTERKWHYCGPERKIRTYEWQICSCCPSSSEVCNFNPIEEIAKLTAEVKQLRDEDATDPIDERLAAAGKIFRELVAEREELRREVKGLRKACASALLSLEAQRKYIVDDLQAINHGEDAIGALQFALTEAKQ